MRVWGRFERMVKIYVDSKAFKYQNKAFLTTNGNENRKIFQSRYTWSQFIDLISNRIIVNGYEHSKVLSSRSTLITQEEIHFCLPKHVEWKAKALHRNVCLSSVFSYRWLFGFRYIVRKDKVYIQINWYFSCSSCFSLSEQSRKLCWKRIKHIRLC